MTLVMNFQLRLHVATGLYPLTESFVGGRTSQDNKEFCLRPEKFLLLCDMRCVRGTGTQNNHGFALTKLSGSMHLDTYKL